MTKKKFLFHCFCPGSERSAAIPFVQQMICWIARNLHVKRRRTYEQHSTEQTFLFSLALSSRKILKSDKIGGDCALGLIGPLVYFRVNAFSPSMEDP